MNFLVRQNKEVTPFLNLTIIKFALVGGLGFLVDLLVTWLLKEHFNMNPYLSNATGFIAAVSNNFWINKYWTFSNTNKKLGNQFVLFLLISVIGLCLNTLCLYAFVELFLINFYMAKAMAVLLVFIWNYFANKAVTFRNHQ